mmetsp:Transcript_35283/g.92594  ORF Transcript_35283/g.92594 Transcript_35283/m.92594 type:complete len:182 (-) Transcript_35283:507-1052(-)
MHQQRTRGTKLKGSSKDKQLAGWKDAAGGARRWPSRFLAERVLPVHPRSPQRRYRTSSGPQRMAPQQHSAAGEARASSQTPITPGSAARTAQGQRKGPHVRDAARAHRSTRVRARAQRILPQLRARATGLSSSPCDAIDDVRSLALLPPRPPRPPTAPPLGTALPPSKVPSSVAAEASYPR